MEPSKLFMYANPSWVALMIFVKSLRVLTDAIPYHLQPCKVRQSWAVFFSILFNQSDKDCHIYLCMCGVLMWTAYTQALIWVPAACLLLWIFVFLIPYF